MGETFITIEKNIV